LAPGDRLEARGTGSLVGARARSMLLNPSRVSAIFWAGGVAAVVAALSLGRWQQHSFIALVIIAGVCATAFGIRVVTGRRLPRWTLHVDVVAASVLASFLAAIGATDHIAFADLYIWVALFAALYFRPLAMLVHVGGVGVVYIFVLAFGPPVANPVAAWLALFGTVAVAAAVLSGVVSVLHSAARADPLTGLANRRSWDERLEEELERARRTGGALSVAVIDVDDFKAMNDRSGHEAGDLLLVEIARRWHTAIRGGGDVLARLGGDEFGVLAPGAGETDIRRLAERLDESAPEGVSCSIGVATWDGAQGGADLIRGADRAMYAAKRRRRRREGLRQA